MGFKDLHLADGYDSSDHDLLNEFYIPVLAEAVEYDRIAGFFSSTSLSIAARGIAGLVKNNGKMRLLVSPRLSERDVETLEKAIIDPEVFLERKIGEELDEIEKSIENDHFYALGWMIANNYLDFKIALVVDENGTLMTAEEIEADGIFHQKVGILKDKNCDILTFSGSINESASAWVKNVEEFKVYRYWKEDERKYAIIDIDKFQGYWSNGKPRVRTRKFPEALEKKWIERVPKVKSEIALLSQYKAKQHTLMFKETSNSEQLQLFYYQKDARKSWIDNGRRGMLEMATGTGKTRTAIGCLIDTQIKEDRLATIIACPQSTLAMQWKNEIEKLQIIHDKAIIADGTNPKWRNQLVDCLIDLSLGVIKSLIVYTTHSTFSSDDFVSIIKENKRKLKYLLIGDEAHGLGANQTSSGLVEEYDYRLGLSATPKRWYDERGTRKLYGFFNKVVYEFSIRQALDTINPLTGRPYLVKYYYHPIFVNLDEDELETYYEKTKKIIKLFGKAGDDEYASALENLLFARANIIKNAEQKYIALERLLDKLMTLDNTIIFTSPEQLQRVNKMLSCRGIRAHQFTEEESTVPQSKYNGLSEREYILDKFRNKRYQALVAIKCLDEGIDIPSAHTAILMSSSTNPREYIQRIGRVIRQSPEKEFASIYDIIVRPNLKAINSNLAKIEKSVFEKELERAKEIAENAQNNSEALIMLNSIRY